MSRRDAILTPTPHFLLSWADRLPSGRGCRAHNGAASAVPLCRPGPGLWRCSTGSSDPGRRRSDRSRQRWRDWGCAAGGGGQQLDGGAALRCVRHATPGGGAGLLLHSVDGAVSPASSALLLHPTHGCLTVPYSDKCAVLHPVLLLHPMHGCLTVPYSDECAVYAGMSTS